MEGLRLAGQTYRPIQPDENGRFWSEQLKVFFGVWHGVVEGREGHWVRLYRPDGSLVPTPEEQAEAADERLRRSAGGLKPLRRSSLGCGLCSKRAAGVEEPARESPPWHGIASVVGPASPKIEARLPR